MSEPTSPGGDPATEASTTDSNASDMQDNSTVEETTPGAVDETPAEDTAPVIPAVEASKNFGITPEAYMLPG